LKVFFQGIFNTEGAVPGAVIAIQSFGDFLGFNPHLHIPCSDGCLYREGMFRVVPRFDTKPLEEIFRHRVFKMLPSKGKISEDLVGTAMRWPHSGFEVYCGPRIQPGDELAMGNLARYIVRASFSQERMTPYPGRGRLRAVDDPSGHWQTSIRVKSSAQGIARALVLLGQKTSENPAMWWEEGYTCSEQVGENLIDAGKAGSAIPVMARAYLLKEKGSGVGARQYEIDFYINGSVRFGNEPGTPTGEGVWRGMYPLADQPGVNEIPITATATVGDEPETVSMTVSVFGKDDPGQGDFPFGGFDREGPGRLYPARA